MEWRRRLVYCNLSPQLLHRSLQSANGVIHLRHPTTQDRESFIDRVFAWIIVMSLRLASSGPPSRSELWTHFMMTKSQFANTPPMLRGFASSDKKRLQWLHMLLGNQDFSNHGDNCDQPLAHHQICTVNSPPRPQRLWEAHQIHSFPIAMTETGGTSGENPTSSNPSLDPSQYRCSPAVITRFLTLLAKL
jgi:hypothetical protein